jgi:hypothetical protein
MPFIVAENKYDWWLSDGKMFETVLNFPDRTELNWCPVQRDLNKAGTEGAELIRPAPIQKGLI